MRIYLKNMTGQNLWGAAPLYLSPATTPVKGPQVLLLIGRWKRQTKECWKGSLYLPLKLLPSYLSAELSLQEDHADNDSA